METGTLNKRKQQALATRTKILKTSIRLINERGYEQVTVDDICMACGVSKGAFYHHFKSKLDIISESEQQLNEVLESIYQDSYDEPVRQRILIFINSMLAEVEKTGIEFTRQRTVYVVNGEYARREDRKTFSVNSRGVLRKILQHAVEHGELKTDTPVEQITELLMIFVCGQIADWCIFDAGFSLTGKSWELSLLLVSRLLDEYML